MSKKRSRNPDLRAFGGYLQALRGKSSREQISIKLRNLGVPLGGSTLLQYEKGTVWAPDPGVLWGLAKIYNRPLDELVLLLRANRAQPGAGQGAARDLIRQAGEYRSTPSQGGLDDAAATRIRELENRLAEYETATSELRPVLTRLVKIAARRGQGRKASSA